MTNDAAPAVTVYTKPRCQQCIATKRALTDAGIAHEVADLRDPGNLAAAKALGYLEAPVIVVAPDGAGSEVHWSGFRPDKIQELIEGRLV